MPVPEIVSDSRSWMEPVVIHFFGLVSKRKDFSPFPPLVSASSPKTILERSDGTNTALGSDARSIDDRVDSPSSRTRALTLPGSRRAARIELVPRSMQRIFE